MPRLLFLTILIITLTACLPRHTITLSEQILVKFKVYQDRLDERNIKSNAMTVRVDFPLTSESACEVAQKACGSQACRVASRTKNLSRNLYYEEQSFGKFDWRVNLDPVCGDTIAYINEAEKTVVCFCAYE